MAQHEGSDNADEISLNFRERATLRAVATGRAEISCSREPDLFVDGLACCDQLTVHALARKGLLAPARVGKPGELVPAQLTEAGHTAVALEPALL